ncbi:MAG: hypothetical protein RMJ81_03595 [Candidatus Kryptonium sp.]|nr:hypothetical protein [Candidatus Kryptonium sp.]MCX7761947.1 hypothetical protein [Candidatus Kryptonium sp.]MDW8108721.1 hypothetical protein [Candidatus Kryptonium sp.]
MFQTEKALIILPARISDLKVDDSFSFEEKLEIYKAILHDTSEYYVQRSRNTNVYVYFPDYETCDLLVQVFPLRVRASIVEGNGNIYFESISRAFKEERKFVVLLEISSFIYPIPWINNAYEVMTHKYDVIVTSIYRDNPNKLIGLKKMHERFLMGLENECDELNILKFASEIDVLYVPLRRIEYAFDIESLKKVFSQVINYSKDDDFKRTRLAILNLLKKRKITVFD